MFYSVIVENIEYRRIIGQTDVSQFFLCFYCFYENLIEILLKYFEQDTYANKLFIHAVCVFLIYEQRT